MKVLPAVSGQWVRHGNPGLSSRQAAALGGAQQGAVQGS